jgi:hypothetical protein
MAFAIGSISFDLLRGDIVVPQMQKDLESRVGQDGVTAFTSGRRGRPFRMESVYAFSTYELADAARITYAGTFGLTPQNLEQGPVLYNSTIKFVVLEVESGIESAVVFQCPRGRIAPAYLLRAFWTLQAVEVA